MLNNPAQLMQMLNQFTSGYRGNAEQEARQLIQQANLNQSQLNKLQNSANMIYGMAQRFGLLK